MSNVAMPRMGSGCMVWAVSVLFISKNEKRPWLSRLEACFFRLEGSSSRLEACFSRLEAKKSFGRSSGFVWKGRGAVWRGVDFVWRPKKSSEGIFASSGTLAEWSGGIGVPSGG